MGLVEVVTGNDEAEVLLTLLVTEDSLDRPSLVEVAVVEVEVVEDSSVLSDEESAPLVRVLPKAPYQSANDSTVYIPAMVESQL